MQENKQFTRASVRYSILSITSNFVVVGNKNCFERLKREYFGITKDFYEGVRDEMITQGILARGKGRYGSIYQPGPNGEKPKETLKMFKAHDKIMAVLMKNENDRNPKFLGREILNWEDSEYENAIHEYYVNLSSMHRVGNSEEYIACEHCLQAISISGIGSKTGERTFKHRKKSGPCVFKSDSLSKSEVYAEMYDGGVVSEEHEYIVNLICESLVKRHGILKFKKPGVTPVLQDHPERNKKAPYTIDGNYIINRRPDISFSFVYEDNTVEDWAIEVQRSRILNDDINQRTSDYKKAKVNLLWVMLSDLSSKPRSRAAGALQAVHRGCQITLNGSALEDAIEKGILTFYVSAYEGMDIEDFEQKEDEDFEGYSVVFSEKKSFPDDFLSVNNNVFSIDFTAKEISKRAKGVRNGIISVLRRINLSEGCKEDRSDVLMSVNIDLLAMFDEINKNVSPDRGYFRHGVYSKIWRTVSVMLTILVRKFGYENENLTTSFTPDPHWIFSLEPKKNLYTKIINNFYLLTGLDFPDRSKVIAEHEAEVELLHEVELKILEHIFPEIYNIAINSKLDDTNSFPKWLSGLYK